jgi:hypothetical protein
MKAFFTISTNASQVLTSVFFSEPVILTWVAIKIRARQAPQNLQRVRIAAN